MKDLTDSELKKSQISSSDIVYDPSNDWLSVLVATNGRFNSGCNIIGNQYRLSYRWPDTPRTSYTTIRIDGTNYIYGTDGTQVQEPIDTNPLLNYSAWRIGDILIEQTLEIIINPYTNRMDTCRYNYEVTNSSANSNHTVGIRIMIDTHVKDNDNPTLTVSNVGPLYSETEYTSNIPPYWEVYSNYPSDLSTSGLGILTGVEPDQISPDRVVFARWNGNGLYNNKWDYTIDPSTDVSNTDNAVAVYWNEITLEPLSSINRFTCYGLGPDETVNIKFLDYVSVRTDNFNCFTGDPIISVSMDTKIFRHKYINSEADCNPGTAPSNGDDLVFTLVFGNYGELNYVANPLEATVEDDLYIQPPLNLQLMNYCTCDEFALFNLATNTIIKPCDVFFGGTNYNLQVRKLISGGDPTNPRDYFSAFDLPHHSIYCISMIFRIEL